MTKEQAQILIDAVNTINSLSEEQTTYQFAAVDALLATVAESGFKVESKRFAEYPSPKLYRIVEEIEGDNEEYK